MALLPSLKRKSNLIAAGIALAATAWVASGVLFGGHETVIRQPIRVSATLDGKPGVTPSPNAHPDAVSVRARVLRAQDRVSDVIVRGRTEALRRVAMRAEIEG
ncbi:MAG TPA: hypothetical protein EYQ81_14415, partial [Sneathiellales bacterium]|nr:hypothetical protein [Sneathiellales bacterium]